MLYPKHIFLCSILLSACGWSNTTETKKQPIWETQSVVWLVCEDQSLFLPLYGDSTAHMPNLCSLAEEGTVFDKFFAVAPVCSPSRSSIITGIQPALMGTLHMRAFQANKSGLNPHTGLPFYSAPAPTGIRPFTEYLREEGVYCTNNSKEDYNFETPPLAWDASSSRAHWRNRSDGQPFFSVFNFNVTHESQIWRRQDTLCQISEDSVSIPELIPSENAVKSDIVTNYCNLEELDRQIGEVLEELKEDELYESTTIVFFSDHGGPFPRFKRAPTDAGLRVPLVIKWGDSVNSTARNEGLFSFLDLAPSVLEWFGIDAGTSLPGLPILPSSTGHEAVYASADRFDGHLNRSRTVRTSNWRLRRNDFQNKPAGMDISYRRQMNTMRVIDSLAQQNIEPWATWRLKPQPKWELYHSSEDIWEIENLSQDSRYSDTLHFLKNLLGEAFPTNQDFGHVEEEELIEMFKKKIETEELTLPHLIAKGEFLEVFHEDPNVSIGWRIDSESVWNLIKSGNKIEVADHVEEIELMTTRIGWTSKSGVFTLRN